MKTLDDRALDDAMNPDPRKGGLMASNTNAKKEKSDGEKDAATHEDEELDEALDETFPASDPVSPSRIDGPTHSDR